VQHRILIIDDEEAILFALKDYFTISGYEVDCASNEARAEELLGTAHTCYSAVIADLRLTGTGGTEGLEIGGFVRQRCPSAALILFTAYRSQELEVEARRRGFDAILDKPRPLNEVAQVVSELLNGRGGDP
jgi:DNA-binding response OmpR family regulator